MKPLDYPEELWEGLDNRIKHQLSKKDKKNIKWRKERELGFLK